MKTQKLLSALFLSSALLTTACTRDVKLDTSGGGVRSNSNNGNQNANPTDFNLSNFPIVSFIGERHIEAIEMLKLATGSLDAKRTQYTTEVTTRDNGQSGITLKSLAEEFFYEANEDEWKVRGNKILQASFVKNTLVESAEITGTNISTSVDSENKAKNYVNLLEKTFSLKATSLGNGTLSVEMVTEGELRGAKGAKGAAKEISLTVKMVVDAASLETDEVKILSADSVMYYPNANPKNATKFNMPFTAQNLTVKMNSLCNSLIGSANASAGPKFKFVANFDDSGVKIEGKDWTSSLAACGKRPTVDLSRYIAK